MISAVSDFKSSSCSTIKTTRDDLVVMAASQLWKVSSRHANSALRPPRCPRIGPWKRNAPAHWGYQQLPPVACSRPAGAGTPERAFAVASLRTWRTSCKAAIALARPECSVAGLHHEEPREYQLQTRSFRRSTQTGYQSGVSYFAQVPNR